MSKNEVLFNEFNAVINETQQLLDSNIEWVTRYDAYVNEMLSKLEFINKIRGQFREWSPLKIYINTSSILKAKSTVTFDVRYLGQNVARLKGHLDGVHKLSSVYFDEKNHRDFDCLNKLKNVDWTSPEATAFRKYFKNRESIRNRTDNNKSNEEHRLESLWLTEFSKKENKILPYVKPVLIENIRFSMPTPIRASNHKKVTYSGIKGGGIDLFTRTGTGGRNTNLCIMELKDENTFKEPPKDAIRQAIAYATFIRHLLRSTSGHKWWKLFGFNSEIPERLVLSAACVMPSNACNDYTFQGMEFDIDGDLIKLQHVYFEEANNRIEKVITSLTTT